MGKENNCWVLAKLTMLEALGLYRNYYTRGPSEVLSNLLPTAWPMSQEGKYTMLPCLCRETGAYSACLRSGVPPCKPAAFRALKTRLCLSWALTVWGAAMFSWTVLSKQRESCTELKFSQCLCSALGYWKSAPAASGNPWLPILKEPHHVCKTQEHRIKAGLWTISDPTAFSLFIVITSV